MEAPLSKVLDHIKDNLEDPGKDTSFSAGFKQGEGDEGEEKILLTMTTKLAGLPFLWKFYGSPGTKELVRFSQVCQAQ